jgi:hypothetical protein
MPRDGIQPMYLSRAEIGLVKFPRAAEFGVRVAAMGQVITEIGIIRDTPDGGVAAWQPGLRGRGGSSEAAARTVDAVTGTNARSLEFRMAGRRHGIEMISMRQAITRLCFAS